MAEKFDDLNVLLKRIFEASAKLNPHLEDHFFDEEFEKLPAWIREADPKILALMAYEGDQAKQLLRKAGFGCIGMGILATVEEVLESMREWP